MKVLGLCLVAGLSVSGCVSITNNGLPMGGIEDIIEGNTGPIVTQYPVETALLNIYTRSRSETLYAVEDDQQIVSEIRVTPKGAMSFDGKSLQAAETSYVISWDGEVVSESKSLNYFTLNPVRFYGFTNDSGEYSIANQTTAMPKIAKIGDSSALITENVYSDSSKRKLIDKFSQAWSLSQASRNTAWFCMNTSGNLLLDSQAADVSSHCYKINAKGDLLDSKLTLSEPTNNGVKTITYTRK